MATWSEAWARERIPRSARNDKGTAEPFGDARSVSSLTVPFASVEVVAVRVSPPPELAAMRALGGEWIFVVARDADACEIARQAAEHGVLVAPHNPSGPVSTLASAHLCAALPNAPLLEYAWGEVPWRALLLTPPERIENGALVVPTGPGLGAALEDHVLREHAFTLSR